MVEEFWFKASEKYIKCLIVFLPCMSDDIPATNLLSKPRSQGDYCPMLGNAMSKQFYERN